MKKIVMYALLLFIPFGLFAQDADKEAIKTLIQEAYIDGLQNNGDLQKTREGFHPDFNLLILKDDKLDKLPISKWLEYAEGRKKKDPKPPVEDKKTTVEFVDIDITSNAAVAKIDLFRNKKKIYTDYLSLYKFRDGWKIVSKIYYKH